MRFFNTAGPVNCDEHYCLPPLERFDLDEVLLLIEQKKYFVLHAPRQVGKVKSLRMKDFTRQETETLLRQHTEETGQRFEAGVFK